MVKFGSSFNIVFLVLGLVIGQHYEANCDETGPHQGYASKIIQSNQSNKSQVITPDIRLQSRNSKKLQVNKDIFTPELMRDSELYLFDVDSLHQKSNVSNIFYMMLATKVHMIPISEALFHRYDDFQELKASGGPLIDQELCLTQLEELNKRAEIYTREKFGSQDLNLYQLLDTYGSATSGFILGATLLPGAYSECQRLKIISPNNHDKSDTRYCLASFKHPSWTKESRLSDILVIKSGVCIPKSCDSSNYKNKYQLIKNLTQVVGRKIDEDLGKVVDLYCLPDEDSKLRAWWSAPRSGFFAFLIFVWLVLQVYSTYKCEKIKQQCNIDQLHNHNARSSLNMEHSKVKPDKQLKNNQGLIKIYSSLSIINNYRQLFDLDKSTIPQESKSTTNKATSQSDTEGKPRINNQNQTKSNPTKDSSCKSNQILNLGMLEGIRVLNLSYIIFGHVILILLGPIANPRETNGVGLMKVMSNMMPAFSVNTFFMLSGIVTTYLFFKTNNSKPIGTGNWIMFIVYRYMRLMPIYALVFAYTKYLAKYTSHGPYWDYATSSLSPRRQCQEESWLWLLLFAANFKSPMDHCVRSAWYLANDFQFCLVTPFILYILQRREKLGLSLIKSAIVICSILGFLSILLSDAHDLRPVCKFDIHGFNIYVNFLKKSYTWPIYRIPPYLLGFLIGYAMYRYEKSKLEYMASVKDEGQATVKEPSWPDYLKNYGTIFSIIGVISCLLLPVMSHHIPFSKFMAKIMVAFFMTSYHLIFSGAMGLYILLASTGYGNKFFNDFLSSRFWKPLAKLNLCVMLINLEVIDHIINSDARGFNLTHLTHSSINMYCILMSYLVSIPMYILFETPLRLLLSMLMAKIFGRNRSEKKLK